MDKETQIKTIGLVLDNPANNLTTTSRDLLETLRTSIEADIEPEVDLKAHMRLYFFEFEKNTNELHGEFYIKENVIDKPGETHNIALTILCDKDSKEIKDYNVLKQFYVNKEYTDTQIITNNYEIDLKVFVDSLFNYTANSDFNKDFYDEL